MNKVFQSFEAAVADIPAGATVMLGGFGLCGIPENLIAALVAKKTGHLHTSSNNMGVDGFGMGLMLEAGMIASRVGSYVGENKLLEEMVIAGRLDLTLVPQGTLAERIRAGGAGIPAFYTPAGVGTVVAEGKEVREFSGKSYVLEHALTADFALIKAWRGDRMGNLVYRKTARNFNPMMAAAARCTIAEVEELVEPGMLDPDSVVTPGVYAVRGRNRLPGVKLKSAGLTHPRPRSSGPPARAPESWATEAAADMILPGMLHARIIRPPALEGRCVSYCGWRALASRQSDARNA
jgi:3-oxoacid CoA-transferase subunit A